MLPSEGRLLKSVQTYDAAHTESKTDDGQQLRTTSHFSGDYIRTKEEAYTNYSYLTPFISSVKGSNMSLCDGQPSSGPYLG